MIGAQPLVEMGVLRTFCPGCPRTTILSISTFQVARIAQATAPSFSLSFYTAHAEHLADRDGRYSCLDSRSSCQCDVEQGVNDGVFNKMSIAPTHLRRFLC
jgi:hypothetical protein